MILSNLLVLLTTLAANRSSKKVFPSRNFENVRHQATLFVLFRYFSLSGLSVRAISLMGTCFSLTRLQTGPYRVTEFCPILDRMKNWFRAAINADLLARLCVGFSVEK
jgi:hypothetical protein